MGRQKVLKKHRFMALIVMLMFALTMAAPTAYAEEFSDIKGHWAEAQIKQMAAEGIVKGYPDGTFRPDGLITRAEFAVMVVQAFKLSNSKGQTFTDTDGHWAEEIIGTASANGIVSGYSDDLFGPDDPITREQMAVMIVKAAQLTDSTGGKNFADSQEISDWADEAVKIAAAYQLISGYPDNTFQPQNNTTRAEAAALLSKLFQKSMLPEKPVLPGDKTDEESALPDDNEITKPSTSTGGGGSSGPGKAIKVKEIIVTAENDNAVITDRGGQLQLTAEIKPANASNKKLTWSVDKPELAAIDANGLLTALANGTVQVTATAQDSSGITGTLAVEIEGQGLTDIAIKNEPNQLDYEAGEELDLTGLEVTLTYEDGFTEDVKAEDFAVKNIKASPAAGTVLTTDNDQQKIKISRGGKEVSTSGALSVIKSVTGVTLDPDSLDMKINDETTLTANVLPDGATNPSVTWKSSHEAVAAVDGNGKVTAIAAGDTTITVTTADGGYEAACLVNVTAREISSYTPLAGVIINEDKHMMDIDDLINGGHLPVQITVTDGVKPASADITAWSGTFDGGQTGTYELTAAWTIPAGYVDEQDPLTVTIQVKVNAVQTRGFKFEKLEGFDVPAGERGTSIGSIDLAAGVSGGEKPYTFSAEGTLPAWVQLSTAGEITGTRPETTSEKIENIKITVTDNTGKTASIKIDIGAVHYPAIKIQIVDTNKYKYLSYETPYLRNGEEPSADPVGYNAYHDSINGILYINGYDGGNFIAGKEADPYDLKIEVRGSNVTQGGRLVVYGNLLLEGQGASSSLKIIDNDLHVSEGELNIKTAASAGQFTIEINDKPNPNKLNIKSIYGKNGIIIAGKTKVVIAGSDKNQQAVGSSFGIASSYGDIIITGESVVDIDLETRATDVGIEVSYGKEVRIDTTGSLKIKSKKAFEAEPIINSAKYNMEGIWNSNYIYWSYTG